MSLLIRVSNEWRHRTVSVQEAAEGLGMTRQGVLKAIKGKVLPATRVGGTWVLQRSVVDSARARRGA
ncbi:excisionase family DNA-binding protein [Rhodococcus koreensis]